MPKMLRSWAITRDNIADFAENGDICTMYSRYDTYEYVRTFRFYRVVYRHVRNQHEYCMCEHVFILFLTFSNAFVITYVPTVRTLPGKPLPVQRTLPTYDCLHEGGRRGYRTLEKRADRSILI